MTKICERCKIKYDDSFNRCDICNGVLVTWPPEVTGEKTAYEEVMDEEPLKTKIIDSIKQDIEEKFSNSSLMFVSLRVIKRSSYETIEKTHIKNKHGAGTKVLATIVGGPLGYVATTGIKEETSTEQIKKDGEYLHIKVQISAKNIIYKSYMDNNISSNFDDNKINYGGEIVLDWKDIDCINNNYFLILKNGERLECPALRDELLIHSHINSMIGDKEFVREFVTKYYHSIEKDIKEYYLELINEYAKKPIDDNINISNNDCLNELERLANLYEKGLLTDEEFAIMKKKIINNE